MINLLATLRRSKNSTNGYISTADGDIPVLNHKIASSLWQLATSKWQLACRDRHSIGWAKYRNACKNSQSICKLKVRDTFFQW